MEEKYSIAQRALGICILLFAFSGCSKFGPEFGLWGSGRVNPSGVNQLFDKEFEEIDLITLLDPKGKAKEGITWEDLSDQEKLDRAFEAFYHEDYAEDGKRRRNQVQERILTASENRCNLYKAYMKNLNTRTNFLMGATTTILGGAGAIVGGAAARTYAGAAGVVSGVRSEFDQAYYSRKTFGLVATGIDERRKELKNEMKEKRKADITVYTVEEAVGDAILYHGACSMDSGLDEAAKKMRIDYNLGMKQVAGTMEHVKKAAVFAKEIEVIEKKAEAAAKIDIENISFPDPKKVAITVRNGGDTDITVDKIYINGVSIETSVNKIDPLKSQEIEEGYTWASGTKYKIKIATTTGLIREISITAP